MDKITEFIKNFLQTRNITFFIALGIAFASMIIGIVSGAVLAFAGNTVLTILLPILGLLAFIGFSLVGEERVGAVAMGLLNFGAVVALICGVFSHFLTEIQNQAMGGFNIGAIEGLVSLIVCVALLIVCSIAVNVLAWLRLKKPVSAEA